MPFYYYYFIIILTGHIWLHYRYLKLSFLTLLSPQGPYQKTSASYPVSVFTSWLKHFFNITFDLLFNTRSDNWLAATGRWITYPWQQRHISRWIYSVGMNRKCAHYSTWHHWSTAVLHWETTWLWVPPEHWWTVNPVEPMSCQVSSEPPSSAGSETIHTTHLWMWQIDFFNHF